MYDWKKRLHHERCIRDALVACGNKAPDQPDPSGGFVPIEARVFKGLISGTMKANTQSAFTVWMVR